MVYELPEDFSAWPPVEQLNWYMFLYGNAFVQYIQDAEGNVEIEILDPVTVRITREGESS